MKKSIYSLLLLSCTAPALCKPVSEAPNDKVNYPSNFQVEGGCNLFITGEYLYWTAREDGLNYVQAGYLDPAPNFPPSESSVVFNGKLKKAHPEWDNGMRVGAGLNFPKAGYDFGVYWTWFSTDAHASAHSSSEKTLLALWAEPDFDPFESVLNAHAHFNLDLNVVDVEWGRSSWFGGHLSLRPFFGLRGVWIDQDFKIGYSFPSGIFEHIHADADFRGGGMRAGLDTRFTFPWGFSIYGLASGSLLYGQTNADLHIKEDDTLIAYTKDKPVGAISSLQMALGLGWDTHFAKDRLHIELHVGWESNIWFGINQMNHYLFELGQGAYFNERGNLSTQGLVTGGRFDF